MTVSTKHIAVCCNPTVDNAKALKITDTIAKTLSAREVGYTLFVSHWPQTWEGFTDAWIVGGDGTMYQFINQYPELKLPMCLFEGGSGNDLYWSLYGEQDVATHIDKMLMAQPQLIDGGTCNGRFFVNGIGIGFDGAIVKDLEGKSKESGKGSYLFSILKNIFTYAEKECTLMLGDTEIKQDCFLISIANGQRYGGGFKVAPKALLTDGLLDVNIISSVPRLKRMQLLPLIEKGEHLDLSYTQYHQSNKITVHAATPLPAHIDGEYFSAADFEIECLPERFSFLR